MRWMQKEEKDGHDNYHKFFVDAEKGNDLSKPACWRMAPSISIED